MSNMYDSAKTWNPFKGCRFDCSYCKPSFQAQAKRQKHNCRDCYDYRPHMHRERMDKIPRAPIVFACGNGDIAFATTAQRQEILDKAGTRPAQTFYFQSKQPLCFAGLEIPPNVILVTTLETDLDTLYQSEVSRNAPPPSRRYHQFYALDHPRKVVTVEPVMAFSHMFLYKIKALKPECVWVGYNTRRARVQLTEPLRREVEMLIYRLRDAGVEMREKYLPWQQENGGHRCGIT